MLKFHTTSETTKPSLFNLLCKKKKRFGGCNTSKTVHFCLKLNSVDPGRTG